MDDVSARGSRGSQTVFSAFVLGLAIGLVALIAENAATPRAGVTLQTLFALATLVAGGALVAAVFNHPWLLRAASMGLVGLGVTALLLMTVFPNPRLDPALFHAGWWTTGPIPLEVGRGRLSMAVLLIIIGAILPLARSPRQWIELVVLSLLRVCLWLAAFWQLAYVTIVGQFGRLFDRPATGHAMNWLAETAELLDVEVDQLTRLLALVANHRLGWIQFLRTAQPRRPQHTADRGRRDGYLLGDVLACPALAEKCDDLLEHLRGGGFAQAPRP